MSDSDQTSEAPAVEETSGAEETQNANLSIEDFASSFVEKVESQTEESETEATVEQDSDPEVAVLDLDAPFL